MYNISYLDKISKANKIIKYNALNKKYKQVDRYIQFQI